MNISPTVKDDRAQCSSTPSGDISETDVGNNAMSTAYDHTFRFDLEILYKTGKTMYVSYTLSRAYLPFEPTDRDKEISADIDVTIH